MIINGTKYAGLDSMLAYLCERYLPGWKGTLTVCYNRTALKHHSTADVQLSALLTETKMQDYFTLIMADNLSNPEEVACHEFVHLMQMVNGLLKVDLDRHQFTWCGMVYPASMQYDERPWEKKAFGLQGLLLREYRRNSKTK